ncbi:MAG: hypothetical protein EXS25_11845 [Pedosphaera sp.]|nr:hypothetical protein [Pedosphaera sp.]
MRILLKTWVKPVMVGLAAVPLLGEINAQAQAPNFQSGLKAYWTFDGNFADSTANRFDGEQKGASAVKFVAGKDGFGQAIELNGIDQFIEVAGGAPDDMAFAGSSVSIAGWFKCKRTPNPMVPNSPSLGLA